MNRALLISHFEEENKRRLQEEAAKLTVAANVEISPALVDLPPVEDTSSPTEVGEVDVKKKVAVNVKSKTP